MHRVVMQRRDAPHSSNTTITTLTTQAYQVGGLDVAHPLGDVGVEAQDIGRQQLVVLDHEEVAHLHV